MEILQIYNLGLGSNLEYIEGNKILPNAVRWFLWIVKVYITVNVDFSLFSLELVLLGAVNLINWIIICLFVCIFLYVTSFWLCYDWFQGSRQVFKWLKCFFLLFLSKLSLWLSPLATLCTVQCTAILYQYNAPNLTSWQQTPVHLKKNWQSRK